MKKNKRPLSPFMLGSAYQFQITSVMSILHRIAGASLVLILIVVTWWLMAISSSNEQYFNLVNSFITHWAIVPFVVIGIFAACYHFCNGIRHLCWDVGKGIDISSARKSGRIVQMATVLLSFFLLYLGFFG